MGVYSASKKMTKATLVLVGGVFTKVQLVQVISVIFKMLASGWSLVDAHAGNFMCSPSASVISSIECKMLMDDASKKKCMLDMSRQTLTFMRDCCSVIGTEASMTLISALDNIVTKPASANRFKELMDAHAQFIKS